MLLRQRGGQAFTDDGAVAVASEDSIAVAQLIQDFQDAGITTRIETWSGGWFTAFAEGTLASVATAAWMDGTLRAELPDTAGNWGVYKLPAFEEGGTRASNRGGSNMAIPSQIDDEGTINRAFDYCAWAMSNEEVQNTMLEEFGLFPSLTTAYDADIYDEELDFYGGQAIFSLFAEVAEQIEPYNYTTDTPEVQDAVQTELGNMLEGDKGPEQAMQDAAETVADRTGRDLA
jgi:multiple sugar transport system substrate-binding protein/lactose/L-arabinose transport system substrate-binding protein